MPYDLWWTGDLALGVLLPHPQWPQGKYPAAPAPIIALLTENGPQIDFHISLVKPETELFPTDKKNPFLNKRIIKYIGNHRKTGIKVDWLQSFHLGSVVLYTD